MKRPCLGIVVIALFAMASVTYYLPCSSHIYADQHKADVISTSVLCKQENRYIGWPTITRTRTGELFAVFSGDRDEHVCPWGKTQMIRSSDNGVTWSEPVTVNNTPLDDRDAGIIETIEGTLLVTWFTSLAFTEPRYREHYPADVVKSWQRHMEKLNPEIRAKWLGCWVRRSTDGGKTWEEPVEMGINSPHGPVQLKDGRILYVGKTLWTENKTLGVAESRDDGRTWQRIGTIPVRNGESIDHYHELHAVELEDGKIVAHIRYNPPERDNNIMRQSESTDGGKTWTVPHPTGIWGYPPHLIRLTDGRLLVTYGHRREPYGERACLSCDGGKTWDIDNPIGIQGAINGDLGYPASAELGDGSIFTVYYQIDRQGEKTCLMGTRWRVK
ncbi:MAG: exo-alpha-sialidase [Candidatus Latescibacteria bacterium]|nr:exo-alpha-sialidase [Candidatus Latescibacterota bacterium]